MDEYVKTNLTANHVLITWEFKILHACKQKQIESHLIQDIHSNFKEYFSVRIKRHSKGLFGYYITY